MGGIEWTALGVVTALVLGLGGALVRAIDRINKAETKADAAGKQASSAVARVIETEKQLTDHRVAVARDYVSNATLINFETKVVEAINRLGDRIDALFKGAH